MEVRKIGVTEKTYYRWRKEYGGMKIDRAKRLKEIEKENARLKKLVADLSLDNAIPKSSADRQVSIGNTDGLYAMKGLLYIAAMIVCLVVGPAFAGQQTTIVTGGTGSGLGVLKVLGQHYSTLHPEMTIKVLPSLGSAGGIRALQAGAIDLAISSRSLKEQETENVQQLLLGSSPLIFAVHPNTPIDDMTFSMAASMYSGAITTWPDGSQIRRILRPENDSDWLLMRRVSDEMAQALDIAQNTQGLHLAVTDTDAVSYLEQVSGSFGPTTLAMVLAEKRKVRLLSLAGRQPAEVGADAGYPMRKTFWLLIRSDARPGIRAFTAFIASPEGKKILAELGVVPVEK